MGVAKKKNAVAAAAGARSSRGGDAVQPYRSPSYISHLPYKDLSRFKCVSKLWCELIRKTARGPKLLLYKVSIPPKALPNRLQRTITRTASSPIITPQIVDYEEFKITTLEKASAYSHPSHLFKRALIFEMRHPCREFSEFPLLHKIPTNSINANVEFPLSVHAFVGSARGMLCMFAPGRNIIIWNTTNHSFHIIPRPFTHHCDYYGFGYDCANDDYKIVLGFPRDPLTPITHIFSLKRNLWYATQQYLDEWCAGDCLMKGLYLDSALHWQWGVSHDNRMLIIKFDLSTDSYSMLQSVTVVPGLTNNDCLRIIGVAENCLCYYTHTMFGDVHMEEQDCDMLCDDPDDIVKCVEETVTIWKMTEHGDQIFETIELQSLLRGIELECVHVFQDGHALLHTDMRTILYNLKDKKYVGVDYGASEVAVYTEPEGTGVSDMVL